MKTLEFCAENCTKIAWAIERGVDRLELCDNLAVGGTTPSIGVIRQALVICEASQTELAVMIRARGGDFYYSEEELQIMRADIEQAVELGVKQIVLGCLTPTFKVDRQAYQFLLAGFDNIEVTFHMAFDQIGRDDKLQALDELIELGVKRILMHGSDQTQSVIENASEINRYIKHANDRIEVMVGGGVTAETVSDVAQAVNTSIFHGTQIVR